MQGYPPPGYPPPGYPAPPQQFSAPPRQFGGPAPVAYGPPPPAIPHAPGPMAAPGMPFGGPGGPGGPIVIDVGKTNGRKAVIGAVVAGALGLTALIAGIGGAADGGAGVGAVMIVIGLLLLVLPVGLVVRKDKVFRTQHLVFEPGGLRWHDPKGAPWVVPWGELAAVSISKHSPKEYGTPTLQDKLVSAASDKIAGERAFVRLDIYPADPGFAGRHPELAHLWERQGVQNGYRLPLGSNVKFIPTIAQAMGRFAPQIYRGVNSTEGFMGLT
jgi:hypothetical protein